jgi:hypothetical protein
MIPKTKFFKENKDRFVKVANDDPEGGDFMLFHPEQKWKAADYIHEGYEVASVYETNNDDMVVLDNDVSEHPYKIGYLVLVKK